VIPLQLAADWAAAPAAGGRRLILRGSALVQLVLLGGIIWSAVHRMQLYQHAYGLTELRLYVSVFMGWVTFVLVWLGATVLRDRRQHFAIGALVSALLCAAGLNAVNPHAFIARTNVERAVSGRAYDPAYAASLSADAVPTLVRLMPRLAAADRCILGQWLSRWTDEPIADKPIADKPVADKPVADWRVWNYGEWRARQAVRSVALPRCPQAPQAAVEARPSGSPF
jgi:two-component system sensor histidine kinase BaeS